MTPAPASLPATPWARDRHSRLGPALVLAMTVAVAALAWAPIDWLRLVFGRDFGAMTVETRTTVEPMDGIRLIPLPSRARPSEQTAPPTVTAPSIRSDPRDDSPATDAAEPVFTWDPTTPWAVRDALLAPSPPDSIVTRALLLDALATGGATTAWAYTDTSRQAAAARRFDWMDEYMNRVVRPRLEAEGDAARNAAIYHRAVGEVEEEGGP